MTRQGIGPGASDDDFTPTRKKGKGQPVPTPLSRMRSAWSSALAETDLVQKNPPHGVFAKHVNELLTVVSEDALRLAFDRFAADVVSGRVRVNKTAWFVFYGRREKYLEKRGSARPDADDMQSFTLPESDMLTWTPPEVDY